MYVIQEYPNRNYIDWIGQPCTIHRAAVYKDLSKPLSPNQVYVALWQVKELQFARFIAEAEYRGVFNQPVKLQECAESMDLSMDDVCKIIADAQQFWENWLNTLEQRIQT
jgi:hypothetical protein